LQTLLFSRQIVKVGHHNQGNLDLLSYLWELNPPSKSVDKSAGWIDVGILARSEGLIPYASISLPRIAEEVVGHTIESPEEIRFSDWGRPELSELQKTYAIQDAWLPLHIFKVIADRPPAGGPPKRTCAIKKVVGVWIRKGRQHLSTTLLSFPHFVPRHLWMFGNAAIPFLRSLISGSVADQQGYCNLHGK
jgi:hypothetical protein